MWIWKLRWPSMLLNDHGMKQHLLDAHSSIPLVHYRDKESAIRHLEAHCHGSKDLSLQLILQCSIWSDAMISSERVLRLP